MREIEGAEGEYAGESRNKIITLNLASTVRRSMDEFQRAKERRHQHPHGARRTTQPRKCSFRICQAVLVVTCPDSLWPQDWTAAA